MTDLSYTTNGLFTTFYANTDKGVEAWSVMANHQGGNAKVLTMHLANVKRQLKKAGYSVSKEKPSKMTMDEILNELAI
jgi:hypothetical protein